MDLILVNNPTIQIYDVFQEVNGFLIAIIQRRIVDFDDQKWIQNYLRGVVCHFYFVYRSFPDRSSFANLFILYNTDKMSQN
jgi:hypothetical protein